MKTTISILLSSLMLVLAAGAADAQTIFSSTAGFTSPPTSAASINRAQGRKGFMMEFYRSDDLNPVAITAASATITFSVAGVPKTVEANTLTPALGHAGFRVVDGFSVPLDGIQNGIKIIYNGDFADTDAIEITVSGLISVVDSFAQDHPYTLSYTAGPNLARAPLTVALVLDVSGSMGQSIVGGMGRRIDVLHHATEVFLNIVKGHAMLGDKVGVAYFTTNATAMDLPPSGAPLLVNAHIDSEIAAAIADVNAHNPDAATSIGRGLTRARDSLFVESPAGNSKNILIFSDGENNTPSATDVTSPPLSVTGVVFDTSITRICPFTLGDSTTPGNTLMSNIATDIDTTTGNPRCPPGNSHVVDVTVGGKSPDAQLMDFFQSAMAELFVGDKLETSKSVSGTVGPGTVKTERFVVNPRDISMTIVLSWTSRRIRVLPFQLKAPDGTVVRAQASTTPGAQNSVTTLTLPVLQDRVRIPNTGEWELSIDGNQLQGFQTDYQMFVMLDNIDVATTFDAGGADVGTGEDIPLRVSLKEGGASILGATVTAQILGPSDGIGNILSTRKRPDGNANAAGDIIRSEAQAKLQLLYENPATAGLFFSNGLPTVTLFDDGSSIHGDAVAGDGIYNAIFKDARQEGHYNFNFQAKGNASTNGAFERTRTRSVFVRPKPDAAKTALTVISSAVQPDSSVIVRLKATPRDRFNNFLGPDYLGHMNIRSSQGTLAQPLADMLDGSYEISYRLPSTASNPDITIEVLGTDVVTKPLNDLKPTAGVFKRWAISLHGGSTFPHGSFNSGFDSGFSFGADVEYRFTPIFSVEAFLGHDRFRNKFISDGFYMTHASGQAKFTFGTGTVRPSLHAGLGAYFPEGGGTRFGGNVGASLQFWLTPQFAVEPSYNYRIVNLSGSALRYSTLQGGIRFRF